MEPTWKKDGAWKTTKWMGKEKKTGRTKQVGEWKTVADGETELRWGANRILGTDGRKGTLERAHVWKESRD